MQTSTTSMRFSRWKKKRPLINLLVLLAIITIRRFTIPILVGCVLWLCYAFVHVPQKEGIHVPSYPRTEHMVYNPTLKSWCITEQCYTRVNKSPMPFMHFNPNTYVCKSYDCNYKEEPHKISSVLMWEVKD